MVSSTDPIQVDIDYNLKIRRIAKFVIYTKHVIVQSPSCVTRLSCIDIDIDNVVYKIVQKDFFLHWLLEILGQPFLKIWSVLNQTGKTRTFLTDFI